MQPRRDRIGIPDCGIVLMGVSGCGKSTLGKALAARLGRPFLDGDDFHSAEAIAKMRSGRPLGDADRWPWLDRLGGAIKGSVAADGLAIAACSALKRSYRTRLADAAEVPLIFVLLDAKRSELARRLAQRTDHYMPLSLLDSQFAALERPTRDERAVRLDAHRPVDQLCVSAWDWARAVMRTAEVE